MALCCAWATRHGVSGQRFSANNFSLLVCLLASQGNVPRFCWNLPARRAYSLEFEYPSPNVAERAHFLGPNSMRMHLQGGIYHGRILLPPEYPFKPPSFLMLSPTGRFETNVKICLSISSHHPEHWQPSWSVRTALTALIAFFPTPGNGAIGSLVGTFSLNSFLSTS